MKLPKIQKLPSGSYFCRLRLGGISIPITADSEAECRKQAMYEKSAYLAGRSHAKKGQEQTVGELIDRYLKHCRDKCHNGKMSPSTLQGYEHIRRDRFQGIMQKRYRDIHNWQVVVDQELVSPKTIHNAWGLVSAALRFAELNVPAVRLPAVPKKPIVFLSYEQIPIFLDAIYGRDFECAALLALMSLRKSEVYGLLWRNVDLAHNQLTVRRTLLTSLDNGPVARNQTKTATSTRTISIPIPRLSELLCAQRGRPEDPVVTLSSSMLYKRVNAVCAANDLPLVGVQGLRRSFASLAYHLNLPERVAMQIGGWADAKTMHKHYIAIADADLYKHADNMTVFFENLP